VRALDAVESTEIDPLQSYYERHRTDLPRLDMRLKKVVSIVAATAGARLLDIGCGRGTLLAALRATSSASLSRTFVGVDISEVAVRAVRAAGFEADVASLASGLPFPDESFDIVIFGEVIEHLYDPDAALLEISRILKRDGRLILTTPNLAFWVNRLLLLTGTHPIFPEVSVHVQLGRRLKKLGQGNLAVGHIRVFTLPALRDMLAGNGFETHAVYGTPSHEDPGWGFKVVDGLFSRIPSLASNFVVVAANGRTLRTTYAIDGVASVR